mmetsp:Transcript_38417/g.69244  ORF Transcript_38417/g.69244 Transcript_38417/m.69244 type:complete len:131 (-) Transcript_38417:45-437(-)
MSTLFSSLRVAMSDAMASLSTLEMAPRAAAWRLASSAKMGLRRDMPFAASLITGFGFGMEGASVSDAAMESAEFVLLEAADVAKADADVESTAVVRRQAKDFMVVDDELKKYETTVYLGLISKSSSSRSE